MSVPVRSCVRQTSAYTEVAADGKERRGHVTRPLLPWFLSVSRVCHAFKLLPYKPDHATLSFTIETSLIHACK